MRTILGLAPVREGSIEVFGLDLAKASEPERRATERRWGILFQQGALFSSLSVRQNVQFPMREYLDLSDRLLNEVAMAKLEMVGLTPDVAEKFPAELIWGHDQAKWRSPGHSRLIPKLFFWMSRRPGSIRSALMPSTT